MATVTPEQMKKALSSLSALEGMASGYCELQDGFDTSKGIAENVRQVLAALASPPAEDEHALPTKADAWSLHAYVVDHAADHDDDCPGDDTCDCQFRARNEAVSRCVRWLIERPRAPQAPPASDPPGLSAEATLKSLEIGFCSSNCGPVYRADEDGCCVTCGGDITFHDRSRPLGQTRCTVCRDTALPCQLGHTGRMLGPQPVAQAPPASDPPGLVANWRPIETAPKRTDVLAGWADRPHWLPQVLQQDDAGMWFNGEESDYRPPTHWMPLPASPQAKED